MSLTRSYYPSLASYRASKQTRVVIAIPYCDVQGLQTCLKHSNFFMVASPLSRRVRQGVGPRLARRLARRGSTTGVLNATTLIYARRAGITAAAGTRLALF